MKTEEFKDCIDCCYSGWIGGDMFESPSYYCEILRKQVEFKKTKQCDLNREEMTERFLNKFNQ